MARRPGLILEWTPEPERVARDLDQLADNIQSFREPLQRSVDQVIAPSMSENFQVGGRPPWDSLAGGTVTQKGSSQILVDTGALAGEAGDTSSWQISDESAEFVLGGEAWYGIFHQYGYGSTPARSWAVIQSEDEDDIERIFDEWIGEQAIVQGF
jgi:phage gpG-like protein